MSYVNTFDSFNVLDTTTIDTLKIFNNTSHNISLDINETENQETIKISSKKYKMSTYVIPTNDNCLEVRIQDCKDDKNMDQTKTEDLSIRNDSRNKTEFFPQNQSSSSEISSLDSFTLSCEAISETENNPHMNMTLKNIESDKSLHNESTELEKSNVNNNLKMIKSKDNQQLWLKDDNMSLCYVYNSSNKNTNEIHLEKTNKLSLDNKGSADYIKEVLQDNLNSMCNNVGLIDLKSSHPSGVLINNEENGKIMSKGSSTENKVGADESMDVDNEIENTELFEIFKPIEICSLGNNNEEFGRENFFKGCKWAPDGTCIMTSSNDNSLRIFDLPSELHCKSVWNPSVKTPPLNHSFKIKEGGIIYDYAWYPKMNSDDRYTSCILSSSMDAPIHLWDSLSGELRASYKPYNNVDEVTHAYSISFSPDGTKIYAGFTGEIKVFTTIMPGRHCISRNLKSVFRKNIVSAIAINPITPNIYAVGTYSKLIGLFTEPDGAPLCFLNGHKGGITHLEFSANGILLFSGSRTDSEILCWDLRNPGCVLYSFPRTVTTNQRIYFDLAYSSSYLLSGNTCGKVSIWPLTSSLPPSPYQESSPDPAFTFSAHGDCTNGINVHPYYPILATTSGQRHVFPSYDKYNLQQNCIENNLKLWWIGR